MGVCLYDALLIQYNDLYQKIYLVLVTTADPLISLRSMWEDIHKALHSVTTLNVISIK